MRSHDYWLFGIEKEEENLLDIDNIPKSNIAIFVGNERTGLSKELLSKLDGVYSIPMNKKVESLNVSVAAGIVMEKIYNKTRLK